MWKKSWVKVIFVVLIMWLILVGYYCMQHQMSIWQYTINQEMDLKDVKIKIEEVRLESDHRSSFQYNNELLMLKLRGKIIANKALSDFDAGVINQNIDIDVIDGVGAHHSSGGRWQHEDGSNILKFEVRGNLFPKDRINNVLTIIATDKKNDITDQIKIKPEYIKKSYGFFSRKPIEIGWDLYNESRGIDDRVLYRGNRTIIGMIFLSIGFMLLGFGGILLTRKKLMLLTLIERLILTSYVWVIFPLLIKEYGWDIWIIMFILFFITFIYFVTRGKYSIYNTAEEDILFLLQETFKDQGMDFDTKTLTVKMINGEKKEIGMNGTAMLMEINLKRIKDKKLYYKIVDEMRLRLDHIEKENFSYIGLFYIGMGVFLIGVAIYKANVFGWF